MKISLEKKISTLNLEKKAPTLLSLAKTAKLSLEKISFTSHTAQVALVMDISGSMRNLFQDGTVQELIARTMALGLNFDDNGAIDIFAFGENAHNLGELTVDGFHDAANWILSKTGYERDTKYAEPILAIAKHYGLYTTQVVTKKTGGFLGLFSKTIEEEQETWAPSTKMDHPIYVLFVTDGENTDKNLTRDMIKAISQYPIFFQFIGVGAGKFSFLEELDSIEGRVVDNANFFAVPDPKKMSPEDLFTKMTAEYPEWVQTAKKNNWI